VWPHAHTATTIDLPAAYCLLVRSSQCKQSPQLATLRCLKVPNPRLVVAEREVWRAAVASLAPCQMMISRGLGLRMWRMLEPASLGLKGAKLP